MLAQERVGAGRIEVADVRSEKEHQRAAARRASLRRRLDQARSRRSPGASTTMRSASSAPSARPASRARAADTSIRWTSSARRRAGVRLRSSVASFSPLPGPSSTSVRQPIDAREDLARVRARAARVSARVMRYHGSSADGLEQRRARARRRNSATAAGAAAASGSTATSPANCSRVSSGARRSAASSC